MVKMESRQKVLEYLKRHGSAKLDDLTAALELSENAVRYHLNALKFQGFLSSSLAHSGVGRPANTYRLTASAESLFPKQYQELLELVLAQVTQMGILEQVITGLTQRMTVQLQNQSQALANPENQSKQVEQLIRQLDFGGILSELETTEAGWELKAFNCRYRDTGFLYEQVCDILPQVIESMTGLESYRSICQRDGSRACQFAIHRAV
jgi:predicted ArsR family transcriptional regulator